MVATQVAKQYELMHVVQHGREAMLGRARRICDGQNVLIEIPRDTCARSTERLRRETIIGRSLDPAIALRPIELITFDRAPALVFEDFSGVPLAELIATPLAVGTQLEIASALAASLENVHHGGIIHRDINPQNVLFDPRTGVVKLTGFGIASSASGEHWASVGSGEGTPAYSSPEQTGRVDRPIDARSDLYSVGVTLYELLTGSKPFEAHDVLGWVRAHIAQVPAPPSAVAARVPAPVSALVMKLLAKLPEERYQTAAGLAVDLRRCRDEWNATGSVSAFVLGASDATDQLRIPKTLYGRTPETELLSHALRGVAVRGAPRVVLVAGSAGVGKSSLAHSIMESVVRMHGIFVTGKFAAREQPLPYSAIAAAFQEVVPYILAEDREGLRSWRERIAEALGPIGQLVVSLVPALETIIGTQPAVPELPLGEAQTRFFLVVRRFVAALATRGHVLVMFLDDLHRADAASLALVEDLVTHAETGHLMVIGAYRDDQIAPDHPLHSFVRALRRRNTLVEVALAPLALENVTDLCADALSPSVEPTAPLARVVFDRTAGNALSVNQLLVELYRDGLLVFDPESRAWRWELARLGDVKPCESIVELMLARLDDLGRAARNELEAGACLGGTFDSRTLALVTGASADETDRILGEAVEIGILASIGDAYHFLRDRIQVAIYEGIVAGRRAELHARIGRRLVEHLAPHELARRVFEVAGQLNLGASLLRGHVERDRVAELDLQAGRVAAASSACAAAASYFAAGTALLDTDAWERNELPFSLHFELARCELAQGHFDEAHRLIGVLRDHARAAAADRARAVDRLQVELHLSRTELTDAVRIALASLASLGVELTPHPTSDELATAERGVWTELADRPIEGLASLPVLAVPDVEVALELLAAVLPPAYTTDRSLHGLIACRMVTLSLRHGVTGASAQGFAAFALEQIWTFGHPDHARRFAELAVRLIEKHGFLAYAGKTLMILGAFVAPRLGPLGRALDLLSAAHKAALDVGDLRYAAYSGAQIVALRLARGDPLDDVEREARVHDIPDSTTVATEVRIQLGFIDNLRGGTPSASTFTDADFDESGFLNGIATELPITAGWFHIKQLQASCLHLDHAGALEHAARARPLLWSMTGSICIAEYHLFAALAHAGLAREAPADERAAHLQELVGHEASLRGWADACPESFLYMRALVSAERTRLAGSTLEAIQLYEQAIHAAHDNGFTHGQAIAYERAATFYAELGLQTFADLYLREARRAYVEWGAHRKVRALDQRHPHLVRAAASLPPGNTISARSDELDRLSLLEISQVISSEIERSKLLEKLTQILLEQAGARRVAFLSVRGERWEVECVAGPKGTVPESIVNHVLRSRARVLLHDAMLPGPYSADPYLAHERPRSILCLPIVRHADLIGIVYLDNDRVPGAFTEATLTILEFLVEQAGILLENATLFAERGRAIAERQQAEATVRSVLDNIVDAVYVCDRSARFTFINPAGAQQLGVDPKDQFVVDLAERVHASHADGTPFTTNELPLLRALAGEVVSGVDMTVRDPRTERATYLRVSAAPIQDDTGAIVGAVAMAFNVTVSTELDRLKEQFVRVVVHELKTPITIVKGYADLLRRMDEPIPATQHRLLEALIRGADRIDRLVTDLVTLWQLQSGRLVLAIDEHVDLVDLVNLVVGRLDAESARRISVTTDRPSIVAADRQLLDKVVSNLVDNALRYSPGGGRVEIGIGIRDEQAIVTVADHGIGIPETKQPSLFEPFFRAHTDTPFDFGGLGLGLYVTKAIVLLHRGSISMESVEGRGSTVRLSLPLQGQFEHRAV